MKTIVRSFVIALAVTGAIATSYANGSTAKATVTASQDQRDASSQLPPGRCRTAAASSQQQLGKSQLFAAKKDLTPPLDKVSSTCPRGICA